MPISSDPGVTLRPGDPADVRDQLLLRVVPVDLEQARPGRDLAVHRVNAAHLPSPLSITVM